MAPLALGGLKRGTVETVIGERLCSDHPEAPRLVRCFSFLLLGASVSGR